MKTQTASFALLAMLAFVSGVMAVTGDVNNPITLTVGDSYIGSTVGMETVNSACNFEDEPLSGAMYFSLVSDPEYSLTVSTCGEGTDFATQLVGFIDYSGYGLYCQSTENSVCSENGVFYTLHGEEQFDAMPGINFLLAVTGANGEEGNFNVTVSGDIPDETWDECFNYLPVYGPQSFMGRIYPDGSGTPPCGIDSQSSVAWYSYQTVSGSAVGGTGFASSTVTITTCSEDTDFDTVLFMTGEFVDCDGIVCSELSDNYCADDVSGSSTGSTLIFDTGTSAFIIFGVAGKGSANGVYRLTITEETDAEDPCFTEVCGESCELPLPLRVGTTYVYTGETTPTTTEPLCGIIPVGWYVHWFSVTSPLDTSILITTCDYFFTDTDTLIAVVDSCDGLECVAYNDDYPCYDYEGEQFTSAVTFNALAHHTYYVALSTYDNQFGSTAVTLEAEVEF